MVGAKAQAMDDASEPKRERQTVVMICHTGAAGKVVGWRLAVFRSWPVDGAVSTKHKGSPSLVWVLGHIENRDACQTRSAGILLLYFLPP